MALQWINGADDIPEMATKTNVNFNALQEGVTTDIAAAIATATTNIEAYADTVSATAKTEAIAETQTWAKGVFTRKNLLIDGDFQLWLDGTSFVAPSNAYTATMWKCNGAGTVTKVASGMQITGTVTIMQIMEALNFNKINGKTVTLSYSLNGVVTTSTYTASSATVISLTITDKIINWIKLEEGDFRTPFESNPYGDELFSSQRYYEKSTTMLITQAVATSRLTGFRYIVNKRAVPTITIISEDGTLNAVSRYGLSTTKHTVTGYNLSSVDGMLAIQVASADLVVGAYYVFKYIADSEL